MTEDDPRRWRSTAHNVVYGNPWIEVSEHAVIDPNGNSGRYGLVHVRNLAIGVLPIDHAGRVCLVGQHRFPGDYYSWELPEGGGPADVDPLISAQRELKEETGLTARGWLPLLSMDLSNAITDERARAFLAWDLTEGAPEPEESEALRVKWLPFGVLLAEVCAGAIRDAFTQTMVLKAEVAFRQGELPAVAIAAIAAGHDV